MDAEAEREGVAPFKVGDAVEVLDGTMEWFLEKIIELPDNPFNRFLWFVTEGLLNIRVHAGAPWSYVFKYLLFHRNKQVR